MEWRHYDDWLDCTDPDDVLAFLASTPPVEGASDDEHRRVVDAIDRRFDAGGGRMRVSKETGVFVSASPRWVRESPCEAGRDEGGATPAGAAFVCPQNGWLCVGAQRQPSWAVQAGQAPQPDEA